MTRTALAVVFLLAFSFAALAQDKGVGQILHRSKMRRTSSPIKIVEGKVSEINDGKVIIENDYGAKKELKLSAKTKFQLTEKKRVKLNEVKPGTFVKITFDETDLTATKVQETTKRFRE